MDEVKIIEQLKNFRDDALSTASKATEFANKMTDSIALLQSFGSLNFSIPNEYVNPIAASDTSSSVTHKKKNYSSVRKIKSKRFKGSITDTILSILDNKNRFLLRSEIEEEAIAMGKPFKTGIASYLSALKREGKHEITMIQLGHNENVWGYERWLDADGGILPDHANDEDFESLL